MSWRGRLLLQQWLFQWWMFYWLTMSHHCTKVLVCPALIMQKKGWGLLLTTNLSWQWVSVEYKAGARASPEMEQKASSALGIWYSALPDFCGATTEWKTNGGRSCTCYSPCFPLSEGQEVFYMCLFSVCLIWSIIPINRL